MRNVLNRRFKHCANTELASVLVRGFQEVGDIVVHGSIIVELVGIITCVCICLGQVAKLRDACAEWHVSCAFRTEEYGKIMWTASSVRS